MGPQFPFIDSFFMGLGGGFGQELVASQEFRRKLGDIIDGVKESLEAMQDAVRILAMGELCIQSILASAGWPLVSLKHTKGITEWKMPAKTPPPKGLSSQFSL